MSDETEIRLETNGLDKLARILKGKQPTARVGILGISGRKDGMKLNAEIGVKHEFGNEGMPVRSFLRVPITENLEKKMESAGAFNEDSLKLIVQQGSLLLWMKKVATLAEAIVIEAFHTGGFGKWPPSNMKYKKVHLTLIETGQLRDSITSEAKEA